MKKILRILTVLAFFGLCFSQAGYSQELGARFGNVFGNGSSVQVDGVFALGKFSRVHADVNFGNGLGVEALWDFVYRPLGSSPFNLYAGAGPSLYFGSAFGLGVAGEIGLEYRFADAPIVIGADWRPTFVIVEKTDFVAGFGFNIRYVFGSK